MSEKKEITINVDQKMVVALVLVILVLAAGVQAFQLNGLKAKLSSSDLSLSTGAATVSAKSNSQPASPPPSIQDLPQMVGGC